MKLTVPVILAVILVLVILAAAVYLSPGKYDDFARCINKTGAKMYGAFWCSHCNDEKELFGSSWKYVDYVECSTPDRKNQTGACISANITNYPTWVFSNGERKTGLLSFDELSLKTGCPLPS